MTDIGYTLSTEEFGPNSSRRRNVREMPASISYRAPGLYEEKILPSFD